MEEQYQSRYTVCVAILNVLGGFGILYKSLYSAEAYKKDQSICSAYDLAADSFPCLYTVFMLLGP